LKAFSIYAATLVIGLAVFLSTPKRSVSINYEAAANIWLKSKSIYETSKETGHGFLYLPHAAILHVPFALISKWTGFERLGDVLWRILSWTMFAVGCYRFGKLVDRDEKRVQWRMAMVASLLGMNCLRIGQSTLLMTALMLLSIEAWRLNRFNWATAFVVLAIAVKPLALVLLLLYFAISAPMRGRLVIGSLILFVIPFCFQYPAYVWKQYIDCYTMLNTAANIGNEFDWSQLFGMLHFFGFSVNGPLQTAIRILAAIGTLGLVWIATRKFDRDGQAIWIFVWTIVYLMLFNPRTENSTYCMMGPVFGFFISESVVSTKRFYITIGLTILAIGTAGSHEIGKFFTPTGATPIWLAPLCCCVFVGFLAYAFCKQTRKAKGPPILLRLR